MIPPELDARLRRAAQRKGVSKAEWVRAAVERALAGGESDPVKRLAILEAPTGDIDDMLAEIGAGRS